VKSTAVSPYTTLRFGAQLLDPRARTLTRDGQIVPLQEQPLELLLLLVEHADAVVTRDDIRARLWPGVVVDYDTGINYAIRHIRRALGPDRRLLHRLIGPVVADDRKTDGGRPSRMIITAALSSAFAIVFGAGVVTAHTPAGAFIYQHIVHPDRCPYVRMLIPMLRNS
jgi:hypothetical protein